MAKAFGNARKMVISFPFYMILINLKGEFGNLIWPTLAP